jgi:hypothetical protein
MTMKPYRVLSSVGTALVAWTCTAVAANAQDAMTDPPGQALSSTIPVLAIPRSVAAAEAEGALFARGPEPDSARRRLIEQWFADSSVSFECRHRRTRHRAAYQPRLRLSGRCSAAPGIHSYVSHPALSGRVGRRSYVRTGLVLHRPACRSGFRRWSDTSFASESALW